MRLHIGIDDTDSAKGGCTTYIAAKLVEELSELNVEFTDYPNIVRLNPNIPYKTRGNAAVALRLNISETSYNAVQETVLTTVENNSRLGDKGTDPAVVLLKREPGPKIRRLSRRALSDIVPLKEAVSSLKGSDATVVTYGSGLGLVGALGAIGQTLERDHTFELIAYRRKWNCGAPRRVNPYSIKRMDELTTPGTFNNYDPANRRILITPHGPDPVLLGIRGESAADVLRAFHLLRLGEPVERWVIFRTNHATDAHLEHTFPHAVRLNRPIKLTGTVLDNPQRIAGGHVFFTIGSRHTAIRCAAFEPTGRFKEVAVRLLPGDKVTAFGAVKSHGHDVSVTVNLEKLVIRKLADDSRIENPMCPNCGKHMKSAGSHQGFRCMRCRITAPKSTKQIIKKERPLRTGTYLPDRKAHRHLTRPLSRYGFENRRWSGDPPSGMWHSP
ncbi:MAG TPA: tRNA(Ile)(2)-agmatinylcytidine synthase [Candidatus Acidoferrales bacterium]|nr:tRNA(Ile)(2)-agmatinylcytidine synthase [Candidatus Acidoferrales bacterium]